MDYDIIGDIHGHADMLAALLATLGYRQRGGVWQQPGHQAIFVGDFIDRGNRQRGTLEIVRPMVDAGKALAVVGNHEFNALAWHTRDPEKPEDPEAFLREHSDKNRAQHEAFLKEAAVDPEFADDALEWFRGLPLWLDLPGLRVVHACWDCKAMDALQPDGAGEAGGRAPRLDRDLLVRASRKDSSEYRSIETILKGPEAELPDGLSFVTDGHRRTAVRIRWWDDSARTFPEAALADPETRARIPDVALPDGSPRGYLDDKPLFFGHYWMTGDPRPQAQHVACVDYSAGKGGPLVAYRWRGEPELVAGHFVAQPRRQDAAGH